MSRRIVIQTRKTIVISLLILAGIFFGCTKEKHIFRSKSTADYYPLKVGNFWEYRDNSTLYEYHLRKDVVDFYILQGSTGVYKVKYFSTYTLSHDTVVQRNEWFAYQTIIDNEVREFSDLNNPDEYEILLRFPLDVGDSWQEPPRQMDSLWGFSINIDSVVAIENIVTLAGEFEECYKIRVSPEIPYIPFSSERWFKPNIGFVKYLYTLGPREYSLLDYKIIK